jgi:PAS domain S-box-containing protein
MGLLSAIRKFFFSPDSRDLEPPRDYLNFIDSEDSLIFYRLESKEPVRITFLSSGIYQILGYHPVELVTKPENFFRTIFPNDLPEFQELLQAPDGTKTVVRIRMIHQNGEVITTEHRITIRKNRVSGIILNISNQLETERKLRESEERLVIAMQTTGIAIWEWDIEQSLVYWKTDVDSILGVKKGTINESIQSYFDLIHPDDLPKFLDHITIAMQSEDYYHHEHRIISDGGYVRWIEAYARIFRDETGRTIRWLGTLRDITERKLVDEENLQFFERSNNQSRSIVDLATDEAFYTGDLESSLKKILSIAARVLEVERTSIWMFRDDFSSLDCIYYYLRSKDEHFIGDTSLSTDDLPKYIKHVLQSRVLATKDAQTDDRTTEFLDTYSRPMNTFGLMDASIRVRGRIVGIISIEHLNEPRLWKSDEIMYAGLLSDQAAIAIINAERKQNEEQIRLLNQNLERIVEERTNQLRETNNDLSKTLRNLSQAQNQLILSEKMASLGQLIAGIAHEINNPIGAIKACFELIRSDELLDPFNHNLIPRYLEEMGEDEIDLAKEFIQEALKIKDIPTGMLRRKMKLELESQFKEFGYASASQLADRLTDIGIIKIESKFESLLGKSYSEKLFHFLASKIFEEKNYQSIEYLIQRVINIIKSLKNYSHMDKKGEKVPFNVEESIETVLTIFHSKLKNGVEVRKNFQKVPMITCYPEDLMQVWTNLISNALHAMKFKGVLTINSLLNENDHSIVVEFVDTGPGIPYEIQNRIFQPFFTTKPLGEGTGLGLDICKKIIENHSGRISFESNPGRTSFRIELPI